MSFNLSTMTSTIDYLNITFNQSLEFNMTNGTDQGSDHQRSWLYVIPGPLICAFGMICNVLNLCVLSQKSLKDSPYTYLIALAVSDLTLLTSSFIHLVCSRANGTYLKAFYDIYIFFSLGNIFFNTSFWLVVALTIERMLFVIRPLKFRPSKKKARVWIVVVFVLCSVINVPRFYCYKVVTINGQYYAKGTPYRMSMDYYRVSWFHAMVISFVPFAIISVTNSVLVYGLHKANTERASLHSNQERSIRMDQTRLNRTLVAVVVVFFFCTVPSAFVEDPIAYSLFAKGRTWDEYIRSPDNQCFIYISNLLLFVNSSLNFVLYCSFNKKFRIAAKSFLGKLPCYNFKHHMVGSQVKSMNTSAYALRRTIVTKI